MTLKETLKGFAKSMFMFLAPFYLIGQAFFSMILFLGISEEFFDSLIVARYLTLFAIILFVGISIYMIWNLFRRTRRIASLISFLSFFMIILSSFGVYIGYDKADNFGLVFVVAFASFCLPVFVFSLATRSILKSEEVISQN